MKKNKVFSRLKSRWLKPSEQTYKHESIFQDVIIQNTCFSILEKLITPGK